MSVPGALSHGIMAPEERKQHLNTVSDKMKEARQAAVLMLCYPVDQVMHLALILRPIYEGTHSGQVALPGGKVEPEDVNLQATALRETFEEIGVPKSMITVLKPLTKVYIPPSNFWVHPFLGFSATAPQFVLQQEEVAKMIEVPLSQLLDDQYVQLEVITTSYASSIEVPCFKLNGYTVWGATAMMLSELKVLLKSSIE